MQMGSIFQIERGWDGQWHFITLLLCVIATLAGYLVTGRSAAVPLGLLAGAGTAAMLTGKLMVRVQGRYFAARGAAIRVGGTLAIAAAVYFLLDALPS